MVRAEGRLVQQRTLAESKTRGGGPITSCCEDERWLEEQIRKNPAILLLVLFDATKRSATARRQICTRASQ